MGKNIVNNLLSTIGFSFRFFLLIFFLILKSFEIFLNLIVSEELRSKLVLLAGKERFGFIFFQSDVIFALKSHSNLLFVTFIITVLIENRLFYFIFSLLGLFDFVFWHLFFMEAIIKKWVRNKLLIY